MPEERKPFVAPFQKRRSIFSRAISRIKKRSNGKIEPKTPRDHSTREGMMSLYKVSLLKELSAGPLAHLGDFWSPLPFDPSDYDQVYEMINRIYPGNAFKTTRRGDDILGDGIFLFKKSALKPWVEEQGMSRYIESLRVEKRIKGKLKKVVEPQKTAQELFTEIVDDFTLRSSHSWEEFVPVGWVSSGAFTVPRNTGLPVSSTYYFLESPHPASRHSLLPPEDMDLSYKAVDAKHFQFLFHAVDFDKIWGFPGKISSGSFTLQHYLLFLLLGEPVAAMVARTNYWEMEIIENKKMLKRMLLLLYRLRS